ncbi:MAG: tetratricopeptide repeat protein, partial [Myxococcota bacterium]
YAPFIGQLLDPSADEEPLPELPHAMARLRVFQSLTRVLELFCGERAALLVFDDLQWADALSLAALEHLITHLERKPWLIAATLRAEEVTPAVHALLELPGCDLLHVERLDDVTIRRLTALMLGQTPSPLLAETIARRSSGNPFFVAEHLQALIESRTLELNSTGRWTMTASLAELPEPDSIQSLIADRITRLPPHARMVGEVGSLLGRRVDLGLLRTLVSMPPKRYHNALETLYQRQILEPHVKGHAIFVHDKLHEVVYDRIDLERRVELHHKVAEALKDDVAQMGVVAWHWTEAGQPERARGCFLKAAHHAAQRWALIDAQRYFLGALELFEPGSAPHIRIDFVEMVLSKGSDYELLETQVCKALETLQTHGDDEETQELRARAHTALGETLSRYGSQRYTEASQHTAQGLELANALGNISLRARALRTMGVLEVHQHDWSPESCERAMVVYRQASVLWQVLSDPVQEASIIFAIGSLHSNLNHRDDALNCYQHALRLQQANGDRKGEYITQFNLGWLHANEGRYTQAHQSYTAARAGFRSIGDRLSEAITLNNIGLLHSFRCDYRKAIEVYMASVELHRQLKTSSAAFSRINIALMYAYMGDFDRSMEWAQKVMDRIDQEREERRVPLRMILCLIECHRGNLDAALKLCQQELERLDSATFT